MWINYWESHCGATLANLPVALTPSYEFIIEAMERKHDCFLSYMPE